ncbi:MAG: hypothetical protein IJC37_02750 [Clostridia bacterium]|nr:hypothetical protein [Clostridia bacterium]
MKYEFNRTNYKDFSVYELNKLAARAYSIPYSSKEKLVKTAFAKERKSSDIVKVLSGKWDFKYFAKSADVPDVIDTDSIKFDSVKIPSTWQRTGYEPPVYLNCPYPFDLESPNLPEELSVGLYRKFFNAEKGKKYIISFLGVIPCIDLYINGEHVGYSEGAHNTAEFDISNYINDGENELVATIYKWSTATYLECQDMFRENGIFRDVLLYEMPDTYINDFYLKTAKKRTKWSIDAQLEISGDTSGYEVKAELYDGKKLIASASCAADEKCSLKLNSLDITEWNAEEPRLYEAYITLIKNGNEVMCIRNYTGFKSVKIKKDIYTFNGKKIKFKGVNHHDTHYKNGYVMTLADLEADIRLMKSLNVNAVRTSHYPPDHQFLVLCDMYGLYVVDEADIETHGCGGYPHNDINLISHDLAWAPRYLDRVKRMYMRDRNRVSISMWSLGNEAGGYNCQDVCYDFLHSECPEIPVHYEGVIGTKRHSYDVVSEMYTNHANVEKTGKHRRSKNHSKKPFFLCEYAHAMGVGPGALEDYWDILYRYDNLMGGCIWEWADHAVYHSRGKYKFTYGGDHGEKKHDGNFCVDGLVYPDRTPHTGALVMQAVYRPLRAKVADGKLVLLNTNRFRNTSYITANWEIVKNASEILASGSITADIAPCEEKAFEIEMNIPDKKCDCHLNVTYLDGENFVAREQIALCEEYVCDIPEQEGELKFKFEGKKITVEFENGYVSINSATGMLENYVYNGRELINQSPAFSKGLYPNIFRALLDNDVRQKDSWLKAGYDDYKVICKSVEGELEDDEAEIEIEFSLVGKNGTIASVEVEYEIKPNGVIEVEAELKPKKFKRTAKHFIRFGLTLEMPEEYNNIEYYGLGAHENLVDLKAHCITGRYKTTVEEMHEPYIKPQDAGNRSEVRELSVTNADGQGLMFCFNEDKFSFNARNYSQKLLAAAKHQEDLHSEHTTAINIDGFLRGTGTSSCGPDTLEKYDVDATDSLEFQFTIVPIE